MNEINMLLEIEHKLRTQVANQERIIITITKERNDLLTQRDKLVKENKSLVDEIVNLKYICRSFLG